MQFRELVHVNLTFWLHVECDSELVNERQITHLIGARPVLESLDVF